MMALSSGDSLDSKTYVKRQKNDAADVEAICEAVTRPSMRFVPVKTEEQQGVLVLHRCRDLLMRQRTMILNAIRAHFAEFGIIAAQEARKVAELVSRLRDDDNLGLPQTAQSALQALAVQLDWLAQEVRKIEHQLLAWHRQNDASLRFETIPVVGLITATALAVSVPDPTVLKSGRQFAAYLGLVPRQNVRIGSGIYRRWATATFADCWLSAPLPSHDGHQPPTAERVLGSDLSWSANRLGSSPWLSPTRQPVPHGHCS
ncbi:MAG: IS110 family transposase [Falsihalocynthiibacter arcticus]